MKIAMLFLRNPDGGAPDGRSATTALSGYWSLLLIFGILGLPPAWMSVMVARSVRGSVTAGPAENGRDQHRCDRH